MSEAATKLTTFERAVVWRKRWLALQDRAALALLASGLLAAGLILLSRLQVMRVHWALIAVAVAAVAGAFVWHWQRTRATDKDAAFLIDHTFELEDRVTTAHQLLEQGGPRREVET